MTPEEYDAWYETARGSWIGELEYRLLHRQLQPIPGMAILDVGCGTGYFSRRLAADGAIVTGIDTSRAMIGHARSRRRTGETYLVADAQALPFPDRAFDCVVAITSLCFVPDPDRAVQELARVCRGRIALGLLNRASLLYRRKARLGGEGGYQGARWHTASGGRTLLRRAGLRNLTVRSAVFGPGGGAVAKMLETTIPGVLPLGGFLLVCGDAA